MAAVWFIMTEVRATPKSSFPGPLSSRILVECSVPQRSIFAALEMAREALDRDGYKLVDVRSCVRFDLEDWNEEDYPLDGEVHTIVQRVAAGHDVEFGPFISAPGESGE
jgi:hypothetical protein